jgi:hypothetical protein
MGITATVIDPSDMGALERVLEERTVSLFFSESPTNPYLRCVDVRYPSQNCLIDVFFWLVRFRERPTNLTKLRSRQSVFQNCFLAGFSTFDLYK